MAPSPPESNHQTRIKALFAYAAVGIAIMATAAALEFAQGRMLWGKSGEPGFWSGDVWSSHNSQYMFDPYSFTHITHGILWYALVWLVARSQPLGLRALIVVGIESTFEAVENSEFVIRRYRAATMSLDYFGDSVMNSMCDILSCMAGFTLAALLPPRISLVVVIVLEVVLLFWIRDDLFLNIVMLFHPVKAILNWQMAWRPPAR